MADPDIVARAIGIGSFCVGGLALWLNWQKNERDLAAQRPQFSINADRKTPRLWRVKLTVMNPRSVPMAWRVVEIVHPPGARLVSHFARPINADEERPMFAGADLARDVYIPNYPVIIEPNQTQVWEGWALIDDWHGVKRHDRPVIVPIIDGYDMRPSFLRRISMRMLRRPIPI